MFTLKSASNPTLREQYDKNQNRISDFYYGEAIRIGGKGKEKSYYIVFRKTAKAEDHKNEVATA